MRMSAASIADEGQPASAAWLRILRLQHEGALVRCLTDGDPILVPRTVPRYLRIGDEVCFSPPASDPASGFLARSVSSGRKTRQLLFCQTGYVTQPRSDQRGQHFVRAAVREASLGIKSLHIPNSAVRDYFTSLHSLLVSTGR